MLYKEAEYYYKKATELFSKADFENALNNIDLAIRYDNNESYIELKNKIQQLFAYFRYLNIKLIGTDNF